MDKGGWGIHNIELISSIIGIEYCEMRSFWRTENLKFDGIWDFRGTEHLFFFNNEGRDTKKLADFPNFHFVIILDNFSIFSQAGSLGSQSGSGCG